MQKFYTAYDRPTIEECPLEVHVVKEGEFGVEADGYMTVEQMVNELLDAGERLIQFRNYEYPAGVEVPDDAPASRPMTRVDAIFEYNMLKKSGALDPKVSPPDKEEEKKGDVEEEKEEENNGNT